MAEQANLLELGERVLSDPGPSETKSTITPKWRTAERKQMMVANIYVEELIAPDHKARAIWELAGSLNLDGFAEKVKTAAGGAGRPAWDPRLLVSIWVYAYSEGIGSAREIERLLQYEPGFQWLCGLDGINHQTRFRLCHTQAHFVPFGALFLLLELC